MLDLAPITLAFVLCRILAVILEARIRTAGLPPV